jgi:general secretion pathway protein I
MSPRHRPPRTALACHPQTRERGFTLLEVLIALTVASIALVAAMRAGASLAQASVEMRLRTHAQWSAENRLAQIRVQGEWPAVGRRSWDCTQGEAELTCDEEVFATPNAQFRRIEVSVFPNTGQRVRLARLVGFATNNL